MDRADQIVSAFKEVAKQGGLSDKWVTPYNAEEKAKEGKHQFVFFIKPEATAHHKGVDVEKVVKAVLKQIEGKFEVGAIRVVGGKYLGDNDIMVEHYGVISNISKNGPGVITEEAKGNLNTKFKDQLASGMPVLGGHQLLAKYPGLTAFSLSVMNDNLGVTRLAGGTYAMKLNVAGEDHLVLNAFHPFQLVPYTTDGHAIIVMEGLSKVSWEDLRSNVCGPTDPSKAPEGSVRKLFLDQQKAFGMASCDKGTNGCHMSAGPLEALCETRRFFSGESKLSSADTVFGQLLLKKGVPADRVEKIADNIDVTSDGKTLSAFDLTEEVDAEKSAELLKNST